MKDKEGAEKACAVPNPVVDGRRANVNLAYLGAKPKTHSQPGTADACHRRKSPRSKRDKHAITVLTCVEFYPCSFFVHTGSPLATFQLRGGETNSILFPNPQWVSTPSSYLARRHGAWLHVLMALKRAVLNFVESTCVAVFHHLGKLGASTVFRGYASIKSKA